MVMDATFILEFRSPCGLYRLTFEDNGRVAYAYLKLGDSTVDVDSIVGDVWLYNRCTAPEFPEWPERSKIPFANSEEYVEPRAKVQRKVGVHDVNVDWESDEHGPVAYVYVFKDLYGVVGVGDRPGCARFVRKDGPLARIMVIED
jgi:hypothetical protein